MHLCMPEINNGYSQILVVDNLCIYMYCGFNGNLSNMLLQAYGRISCQIRLPDKALIIKNTTNKNERNYMTLLSSYSSLIYWDMSRSNNPHNYTAVISNIRNIFCFIYTTQSNCCLFQICKTDHNLQLCRIQVKFFFCEKGSHRNYSSHLTDSLPHFILLLVCQTFRSLDLNILICCCKNLKYHLLQCQGCRLFGNRFHQPQLH